MTLDEELRRACENHSAINALANVLPDLTDAGKIALVRLAREYSKLYADNVWYEQYAPRGYPGFRMRDSAVLEWYNYFCAAAECRLREQRAAALSASSNESSK